MTDTLKRLREARYIPSEAGHPMPTTIDRLRDALQRLTDAAGALAAAERETKLQGAKLRLHESIDGKNADVREAQFTLLCASTPEYRQAELAEDEARAEYGLIRGEVEVVREELSLEKRQIDLQIATAKVETENV